MKKPTPRLSLRSYRFVVVCVIFVGLIGFGVSVSSHSGGSDDGQGANATRVMQKGGTASLIASLFNAPMPLPSLTATMADSFPSGYDVDGDGKADVGDKIRYTVNIANSGTDATNLTLQDTLDPHTTLSGTLNVSPVAVNDSYDTVANTLLEVGVAASGNPAVRVTDPSKDSAFDNDKEFLGDTFSFDTITVNPTKGTLTFNNDGTFSYQPNANQTGTDTFTYRIKDSNGLTDTAVVTININATKVWYVKNNVAGPGTGTSSDPFKALASAQTASAAGDTIYVMNGDGTTASQNAGFTMKANQRLIGEATQLDVPVSVNGGANPTVLATATANRPKISGTTEGVTALNVSGTLITGLNIAGTAAGSNAIDATTNGGNSGGIEVANCVISAASSEGIDINGGGTGTMTVSIHNNTVTATGNGIDIARTAGSVTVTTFNDNTITGTTGGTGINVVGTGAAVLFDATAGGAYNTVSFGTTVVGASGAGNGAGASGIVLNNVSGDISFTDLDVYTDNGTALLVVGTNANFNAGTATGTRITANAGTPVLTAVGGPALDVTSANINLGSNTAISSTNSASTGVSLSQTSGTFNGASGSSITNATGVDFSVNGGSNANANVGISFAGTITDDVGMLVQIQNVTASSTHTFSGLISDNFDGDGTEQGISLTGNTGANITFSGGINIRTTTNAAFTSTGAGGTGTLTITDPAGATANKLQTTTGTALNVANTLIGASGLTFESISANGGSNGIILSNTGTSGGLTVTGTGGTCTDADKSGCTGGTIQNLTGADDSGATPVGTGIVLNNTRNVSLTRMYIHDSSNYGINGTSVVGFTLANSVISGQNGNNVNSPFRDSSISFGEITGTVNISNSFISGGFARNIDISNTTGSLDITVNACNIHDTGASPYTGSSTGDDNFFLENQSTANIAAHITNNTFSQASGDHFNGNLSGSGTVSYVITGNNYSNSLTGGRTTLLGGGFFILGASYNGNFTYKISNNGSIATPLTGNNQGGAIVVNKGSGSATYSGRIENNVIGNPAVTGSGSQSASGIDVEAHGSGSHTTLINGNTIRQFHDGGIVLISGETTGALSFDATITSNTVSNPDNISGALGNAIHVNTGTISPSDVVTACMDIKSNNIAAGGEDGDNGTLNDGQVDLRVRQRFNSTTRLPGLPASTADAGSFLSGQNTLTTVLAQATTGVFTGGAACATAANISQNFMPNQEQRQYYASTANPFLQSPSSSLFSVLNDIASTAPDADLNRFLSESGASDKAASSTDELSATRKLFAPLFAIEPKAEKAQAAGQPAIKAQAFALAHGNNNSTLAKRLSSLVSAFAETVSPTANAAPAPMPVLDINQNIGTLPAGESITVVFDVTVNGPHPVASYTNQMTVKADGIADVLTDDQPGTAAPNEPTVTPGDRYNTSTNLVASPTSPAYQSDTITFTATVTPTEGSGVTPDGTVQFKDGASNLGSPVTCSAAPGNTCTAQFSGTLSVGAHNITAEYSGGTNHDPSTSNTVAYTINACTVNPVVTNSSDGTSPVPAGSLRDAIINACPASTITFSGVTGQINLVAALPDINKSLIITGPGADVLDVRGSQAIGNSYRVLNITGTATAQISGLTISNGSDALGGGGINIASGATLLLTGVTVKNNTTTATGGGIQNAGALSLNRSTVSNNVASLQGGGIYNTGDMGISNSTISTNTANVAGVGLGGGIYTSTTIQNVNLDSLTIASNSADASGGGIYNAAGTVQIANTIAADNTATASPDLAGAGTFQSNDYNLIESSTVVFTGTTTHNITGVDPVLGPLANNGGPTFTHALLTGSPAIDQGKTSGISDQRNQTRPVDNPNVANASGTGIDGDDIGAYEAPAPPSAPDLKDASDTGTSNSDNVTSDSSPTFTISGVANGEIVTLYRDGTFVASNTAAGSSIDLTDPSAADGTYTYTAARTVNGGTSPASTGLSVTIETVAPTINIGAPSQSIANAATASVTYTVTYGGADAVTLSTGDITLNATGTANATVGVSGSGTATRTVTLSGFTGNGTLGISIGTGTASDTAGNTAPAAGPSATFSVDTTPPTVQSIVRADANPTGASSVNFTVTFSENVTGVDATDFALTVAGISGASVTGVTGSNNVYTVSVSTGTGDGTLRLDAVDDDTITDASGNPLNGGFTSGESYLVDKTPPSVQSIVRASANPTNASSVNFTVTFSENVTGVDATDFALTTTGTVAGASITGVTPVDGSHYTVAVNTGTGDGTIRLDVVDDDTILDQASRPLGGTGAGNGGFTTGEVYTVDKTAPTINIGSPSVSASNGSGNVTFTVTYTDTNFNTSTLSTGNITLNATGTANATIGVDAGSGSTRTVTLSGITGNGTLGISIGTGTASDTAGNTAPAAGPSTTFVVDTVAPTVQSVVRASANPTSATSVDYTVTFSENVTGVDTTDFTLTTTGLTGASVTGVTGSNNVYTVSVNTGTGDGTLRLDVDDNDTIVDQASTPLGGTGTGNGSFTTGEVYTVDKTNPSVQSIVRANANPTSATSVDYTVTFSENVTGVDTTDFTLTTTGAISGQSITGVTGSNNVYTVSVNTGSNDGTIRLDVVDDDTIVDQASKPLGGTGTGNGGFTTGEVYTVDKTAPSVTINQAVGQADPATNATSINFTVVFSETVTGFDAADVDLSTSTAGGPLVATVTEIAPNDGTTYNVEVKGMSANGDVTATVKANAAQDGVLHDSTASTSTDNTVTYRQDNTTTFEVNSLLNTDDGSCTATGIGNGCTLREAINAANADFGAETITFDSALTSGGPATITLDGLGALPDITDDVTITGPTNNRLTISGNDSVRVLNIASGKTVDISNLTIAQGRASGVGTSLGGGIYNEGKLTVTNSTFTGNKAVGPSGMGGAIYNLNGTLTLVNSTVSGNSADADGGGILNDGSGSATLANVTITGNRSDADDLSPGDGGGIAQKSTSPVTLINTIVAGNFKGTASPVADDIFVQGGSSIDTSASKNNLIGDAGTSGGLTNGTNGNIVGNSGAGTINITTVLQTTLASNGGPTQTHLLVPGSSAINAGSNCVTVPSGSGGCLATPLTTDQRGTGFPRLVNTTVDIGAVEVNYAITTTAGTPQSTVINTAFGTLMKATVTESGIAQSNLSVTFTEPGSGASGTFAASSTVQTDVNGVATAPAFTANGITGSYNVVANLGGFPPSANFALTNTKATQTITFNPLAGKTFGDAPFAISATGGPSGNPVVFTSQTPLVCSVSGNTVTILGAGTCTIRASQAGDSNYDPAPDVDQSFNVAKAGSTTTVTVANAIYDGNPHGGTAAVTGAGGLNQSLTVTYTGRNSTVYGPSTTAPTNAGDYTASASFAGDANHNGSNDSKDFQITKAGQTITFNALSDKTFGNADFSVSATATSGLAVSFAASGQCTVTGSTVHLTGAGSCTITASQPGNGNYTAAPDVARSFNIAPAVTTTSVSSSVNPSTTGQSVTFTATVTSGAGTPTGTVQFKVDGSNAGAPVALNGSGAATFSTSSLTVGNHTIAADYSGSANFAVSSGTLAGGQTVNILSAISINDVSAAEGNSGTTSFNFTVSLSQASNLTVMVNYATANGTATAGSDYQTTSGTLTFIPGETQKTVTVSVNGDTLNEPNETFFVNLTNQQNATLADNQGQGTILNDDQPGVQFASDNYTVNEIPPGSIANVVVTRTGDVSLPLTVDFQTSDQSGTTPCQTNNTGFASDRCDYATAAGTLRFAAGEAQRTIPVIIVNDSYVEPTEHFSIKLSNPQGGTLGSTDTATIFINDLDTQIATQNPIDDLDYFLYIQYVDFLGRIPDAAGFQFWKQRMTSNCPVGETCDRTDTSFRFFSSDEFKERGLTVYLFYHAALGRRPTYSEWTLDVAKLNGFQTPAEQLANKDAFVNEFINRTEFINLYNGFQTGQTFVDALIQQSGVTPASRQQLIDNYGTVGRAKTIQAFMETPEVQAAFFDRAFVTMLYFGYLRRDAEPGGFAFWMQKLNDTNHDYRFLIKGFIDSDEYRFRFAQISKQ